MLKMERKWFVDDTKCPDSDNPATNNKLHLYSLRTIYIVAGVTSSIALLIYLICCLSARSSQIKPQPETALESSAIDEATPDTTSIEINQKDPLDEEGTCSNEEQESHLPRPHDFSSDSVCSEFMPWSQQYSFRETRRNNSTIY